MISSLKTSCTAILFFVFYSTIKIEKNVKKLPCFSPERCCLEKIGSAEQRKKLTKKDADYVHNFYHCNIFQFF